jgi:hypothetical protein
MLCMIFINKHFMNLKKIIKEEVDDSLKWLQDIAVPEELEAGAKEVDGGYRWDIKDYQHLKKVYDEIEETFNMTQPKWAINPRYEKKYGPYSDKYFNWYKEKYGDFNLFLPYDKDNIYGWFDGQPYAFDKDDYEVAIPV